MQPRLICAIMLGIAILAPGVVVMAQDLGVEAGRSLSPWFVYDGEASIDTVRAHADGLSSISVAGGTPAAFVASCHELGVEVYRLVGGDGEAFATAEARRQLISSWVEMLRQTGADGIDVNFESLDRRFREPFTALLREAAEALHAEGRLLAMSVSYEMCTRRAPEEPRPGDFEIDGGWYDPAVIGETCDMVRVMCYDMHSTSGASIGPVSTRPWARDAMRFWLQHVPRSNLVMGLPAYSREITMTLERPIASLYAPAPEVPEGTAVVRAWLPYEEINQYRYVGADGNLRVFFASDAASTRAHLLTATELGISTVGFWHFGAITAPEWAAVEEWLAGEI